MKENGRQRNETSDVSKRKTVDKMRYPQLEDKNAVSSVDNLVEKSIFLLFLQKMLWTNRGITVGRCWKTGG